MGGSDDMARAAAVTPDGHTIVAGTARRDSSSLVSFALARYLPDGSLDQNFGVGGKAHTPFGQFSGSGAEAIALQADGKIVVAGRAANPDAHHDTFALARYNTDGSLDAAFGNGGQVLTQVNPQSGAGLNDLAHAVTIDPQGRILVAGETGSFLMDFAVTRYLPDGSLDPGFGLGGIVVTDLGGDDRANAVAVQPDGAILVGGSGWVNTGAEEFGLVRYLPDGSLDPSFGNGGVVVTDFRGGDDRAQTVLLRPDGRIVLAGNIQLGGGCQPVGCERYGFGLAQYLPDGSPDTAFGTGGRIEPDFIVSSGAYAAVLLPDGVVALAGHIGNEDFGLAFVNQAGGPILVEGGSEAVRIDFAGASDRGFAAALSPAGAVVVAGDASDGTGAFDFGLARYIAPTAP